MNTISKKAILYRMVMRDHTCPYGIKAKDLLERQGYIIEEHWLTNRTAVDSFKAEYHVKTTPQIFIDGERIGGYDDLRCYFGKSVTDATSTSYRPVIVLFILTALLAASTSWAAFGSVWEVHVISWFISFSMVMLALLKLQNIEKFSTMFLNYDLLAKRWVPYSYIYPFAEAIAGLLMTANILNVVSIPIALTIGSIGVVSIFKAVYIDKRSLKCACVGGDSQVPLGFISMLENIMMIGMATTMLLIHL
jgi:glutaredoxin